jgi:hypothetical protein
LPVSVVNVIKKEDGMSTLTKQGSLHTAEQTPIGGVRFDWLMLTVSCWLLVGLYVDGWAHAHLPQLETFFTPWHGVFYSGYAAVTIVLGLALWINRMRGYGWRESIPAGYELSIIGVLIFGLSGIGDLIWHLLFGIETSIEAFLSPTHLGLGLGLTLIMSSALRAAWSRRDDGTAVGWKQLGPMIVSLAFTLVVLAFFTEFINPFSIPYPLFRSANPDLQNTSAARGIASALIFTVLLMGPVLLILRRWRLPLGALTLIFTLIGIAMSIFNYMFPLILALLLAGLAADSLLYWLRLYESRQRAVRIFAFAVPVCIYLLYFLVLALMGTFVGRGISWSIHLWMGVVVITGFVGLLLSYMIMQPARSER